MSEPGRRRDATIVDVARVSGVSKSTVSNVIRNPGLVAEATRRRVLDAIEHLDYRPNAVARDLKRMRTGTVGVIVGDLANPFYAELTKLIERRTTGAGYATIICDVDGSGDAERERMELLLEQRVSGVFMTYLKGEGDAIEAAQRAGVPLVGVSVFDRRLDSIVSDDAVGARLAVEHLTSLGHVRIAYVPSQRTEPPTNASRLRGLHAAQRGAGLPPGVAVAIAGTPERNQRTLAAVVHDGDRPTAFLAGNDVTALELIDRLEAAGLRVPGDASVIGYDDIPLARLGRVSLTTLHQPISELAAFGVARMLARIEFREGPDAAPLQVRLAPELIVRGTTAAA
ncbi:MAG: LacI family DNA-binding transcriptional regulator [Solirubrobacteraceae bacterium]